MESAQRCDQAQPRAFEVPFAQVDLAEPPCRRRLPPLVFGFLTDFERPCESFDRTIGVCCAELDLPEHELRFSLDLRVSDLTCDRNRLFQIAAGIGVITFVGLDLTEVKQRHRLADPMLQLAKDTYRLTLVLARLVGLAGVQHYDGARRERGCDLEPVVQLTVQLEAFLEQPLRLGVKALAVGERRPDVKCVAARRLVLPYRGQGQRRLDVVAALRNVTAQDPEAHQRGFETHGVGWIRAAIQEYILHSWSLVKMGTTAAQKKLFFNLRKLKGQMQAIEEGDLSPEQVTKIATRLGVPEEEVVNMNRRLAAPDSSLNAAVKAEGDMEWQDWLVDDTPNQEARLGETQELGQRKHMLAQALKALTDRERHIIVERRLVDEPKTLEDLSAKYGISRERVRQIEVRAFDKLQKAMKNMVVEAAAENSRKVEAHATKH